MTISRAEYSRKWRALNLEHVKERERNYYAENSEKKKALVKAYRRDAGRVRRVGKEKEMNAAAPVASFTLAQASKVAPVAADTHDFQDNGNPLEKIHPWPHWSRWAERQDMDQNI